MCNDHLRPDYQIYATYFVSTETHYWHAFNLCTRRDILHICRKLSRRTFVTCQYHCTACGPESRKRSEGSAASLVARRPCTCLAAPAELDQRHTMHIIKYGSGISGQHGEATHILYTNTTGCLYIARLHGRLIDRANLTRQSI